VKTELFFKNKKRRQQNRPGSYPENHPDALQRLFGSAQPGDIPESSAWWKRQQRDLFCISDDGELGLMQHGAKSNLQKMTRLSLIVCVRVPKTANLEWTGRW